MFILFEFAIFLSNPEHGVWYGLVFVACVSKECTGGELRLCGEWCVGWCLWGAARHALPGLAELCYIGTVCVQAVVGPGVQHFQGLAHDLQSRVALLSRQLAPAFQQCGIQVSLPPGGPGIHCQRHT